jgi:hypothetical protein
MGSAQLAYPSLDLGGQLSGIVMRAMRLVGHPRQAVLTEATQPGVHAFARHPIALGDLNNGNATGEDFHDGVITLLHDAQLHEHRPRLPTRHQSREADPMAALLGAVMK